MNREFDVWMRDYHNRMRYGLDPERRYVKKQPPSVVGTIMVWVFLLSFLATMAYWRTR